MALYRDHTPVEDYRVRGLKVFVKRDDLFGIPPLPALGKLRGLRPLLQTLVSGGHRLIGAWDSRVSRLGEGLAAAAGEFRGLKAIVSYPVRAKSSVPSSIAAAERLGAEVYPIRGNVTPICYAQARRYVISRGGVMLPFGLECETSVRAVAAEAALLPKKVIEGGTLVLCAGSGVTLAGLLRGLPAMPARIIALSSGRSISNIRRCLLRYLGSLPRSLSVLDPIMPYYERPDTSCPFPSHPNYDLKAWVLLTRRIKRFREPILFWNIGA